MKAELWQPLDLSSSELAWSEQCACVRTYMYVGQWRHPLDLSSHSFWRHSCIMSFDVCKRYLLFICCNVLSGWGGSC